MEKFKSQWAIGLVCLALGVMISIQLQSVRGVEGGIVSPQRAQDLAMQITKLKDERDKLMEERKNNLERIKEYEDDAVSGDVVLQRLRSDLENMRMIAGLEDVQGPGIIITVTDPPTSVEGMDSFSLVTFYYEYLLLIINELNAAGVEAISINDQRVISTTEIRIVGYHLSINGVKFSPPMVFKAIGNPEALEGALKLKNGVVETMTRDGIQVSIKPAENLVVPKYNNIIRYRYAKPIN